MSETFTKSIMFGHMQPQHRLRSTTSFSNVIIGNSRVVWKSRRKEVVR